MNRLAAILFVLLLGAFGVFFGGAPLVSRVTGLSIESVTSVAGIAVVILGVAAIVLARIWSASRGRIKE